MNSHLGQQRAGHSLSQSLSEKWPQLAHCFQFKAIQKLLTLYNQAIYLRFAENLQEPLSSEGHMSFSFLLKMSLSLFCAYRDNKNNVTETS